MNEQNDLNDELKAATRRMNHMIWQMSQAGAPLDGEQAVIAKAMHEHPEYTDIWNRLDELSDAEIERDGVNPLVHVQMHAVIENQIAGRDPAEVRNIVKTLLRQGYSRHEAIHAVANVFAEEMFIVLRDHQLFNETRYVRKLQKLTRQKKA